MGRPTDAVETAIRTAAGATGLVRYIERTIAQGVTVYAGAGVPRQPFYRTWTEAEREQATTWEARCWSFAAAARSAGLSGDEAAAYAAYERASACYSMLGTIEWALRQDDDTAQAAVDIRLASRRRAERRAQRLGLL